MKLTLATPLCTRCDGRRQKLPDRLRVKGHVREKGALCAAFNMTLIKGEFEICGGRFHRPGKVIKDKKKDELREEGEAGFTHR